MKRRWMGMRLTAFVLVATLLFGTVVGTNVSTKVADAAKQSKLSKKNITILIGKSQKLNVQNKQKGTKLVWSSSNKRIAKVTSKGKVTGVKQGSTRVVCTVNGKGKAYKLRCNVAVVRGARKIAIVDEWNYKVSTLSLIKGQTVTLTTRLTPTSSKDVVTWKTSNKKVVTVGNRGNVKAIGNGNAKITATTLSKKKAVIKVKVETPTISSYLKDAYAEYFTMGVAINHKQLINPTDLDHTLKHYNSITLENEMKPDALLGWSPDLVDKTSAEFPVPESYKEDKVPKLDFETVDQVLEIAKNNGLKMRGHTLVWHSQTPDWFFREGYASYGNLVSKEIMNARMEYYIQQVLLHIKDKYPGVVYAWDVVNEVFENDGDVVYAKALRGNYSRSNWYSIYKDDSYIINAFAYARKYQEEGTLLFYNDYNEYVSNKRDNIYTLAGKLKGQNLIDGIGMQAHLAINFPSISMIGDAIDKFNSLGLQIHLTEIDMTIPDKSLYQKQGEQYKELFTMLVNKKKSGANITNVTFWGLTDHVSWRSYGDPLLFFNGYQPKPAAVGVLAAVGK